MALSPAEPPLCHHLEEVPSSVPPFPSLDGMGDVSRRSPDAALTSLGPGFTAWPQFAAMCPLLSAQWDLCSYCFPF